LVCLSLRTGREQSILPGLAEPEPEGFRELVAQTARAWRLRPERIEVTDARLAEDLRGFLSAEKVAVELRSDLPELRALEEERARSLRRILPPAALDAPGVTVERLAAFAGAAARFAAAAPWRHLDLDDFLVLEAAGLPRELQEAQILGPPGFAPAVLFHPQEPGQEPAEEPEDGWDDWKEEDWEDDRPDEEGLWKVSLVPPSDLPPEDVELWLEHGLPLARSGAYPLALRRIGELVERPDSRYLRWFEVVLDALASTTEEEMDAGRWEKEVVTSEGPVRLALSLPEVLDPPYADSLPPEDDGEVPAGMRLAFELATEAFGSFGRRQIQLARRAVALWPDCLDAWLVLARRALDPESARDLYAKAVAAGERSLPGIEKRADPFDDEEEQRFFAPYCWARSGLARALWTLGAREEALDHLQWLQAVEPYDRHAAWNLAHALLALGKDEEAEDLLARYADLGSDWQYVRALLLFRREGDSPSARQQMAVALAGDRDLGRQLLGDVPPEEFEDESPALPFQGAWVETPGALEALRTENAALAAAARAWKVKRKGEKKKRRRR
ncbi:MAG TPA: tetratricopeptide repeat protein, partial [Thermoanaerobaculia bacterium]